MKHYDRRNLIGSRLVKWPTMSVAENIAPLSFPPRTACMCDTYANVIHIRQACEGGLNDSKMEVRGCDLQGPTPSFDLISNSLAKLSPYNALLEGSLSWSERCVCLREQQKRAWYRTKLMYPISGRILPASWILSQKWEVFRNNSFRKPNTGLLRTRPSSYPSIILWWQPTSRL